MKPRSFRYLALWTLTVALAIPHTATAADFPYPKVEFSADMTMKIKTPGNRQEHTIKGRVFSAKGRERREISTGGRTMAILKERNKEETVTLMPAQKMYMKNQDRRTHKDPETMIRDGELKMTRVGSEKIDGQTTTKYKIESTVKGGDSFSGHAWFTSQNIPIRFKGTSLDGGIRQDVEINYTNIVVARQNPKLFTIPGDYRLLPTGMGGMRPNMTPEQMKQLKKMLQKKQRQ